LINITVARTSDLVQVKSLFSEYAASSEMGLSFQDLDQQLAFPGDYAPPSGCILLAKEGSEVVGCVALRQISEEICEMKKLYVRSSFRERGIGRTLTESVIGEARARGYRVMRLIALPSMTEALRLCESLGFRKIAPYRHNLVKRGVSMQLDVTTSPFP
jgi:ribosomal protein S18 acetylase RimI-like enzyme